MRDFDEQTVQEQEAWEHYKKIEAENYMLKRQLINRNETIRALKKSYGSLNKKYKALLDHKKPRFRNNGKKKIK
ncbi:hypothetical protein MKX73_19750 [Solibacillus sp. FSL W7-1436]|uniref:hypothetical protein n=1 Tax=Solibacillus sp. FSL W7-1436 TaxID=2921705 RepID=UPI0030FB2DD7